MSEVGKSKNRNFGRPLSRSLGLALSSLLRSQGLARVDNLMACILFLDPISSAPSICFALYL